MLCREKRQKNHVRMNSEGESEGLLSRTLAGEARMVTYKDRIAGRKRVRERRRAQVKRGTGECA